MSMRYARAVLMTALAVGLPAMAAAQNGLNELGRNMKMLDKNFEAADKNHDGQLTRQEAQAVPFIANHFDAIDVHQRGTVSKDDVHSYVRRGLRRTSGKPVPASSSGSVP